MLCEKGFDLGPQGLALGASIPDICRPLRWTFDRKGVGKNPLDLLPALRSHDSGPSISFRSQAFAKRHSRLTVLAPIFKAVAVSLSESPSKKRKCTIRAMRGSNTRRRTSASF